MPDSSLNNFDLMRLHVETLYHHDKRSKITSVNDWAGGIVPRFFLGRTDQGNLCRFRNDLPEEICKELECLVESEPVGFSERPKHETEYKKILSAHAAIGQSWSGPAYWFSNDREIAEAAEGIILITPENSFLLNDGFRDWLPDVPNQQPFVAISDGVKVCAVCASVRITDVAHEAGVETLESHRRKGYAALVVSGWASAVRKAGALPLYSTSYNNFASQNVAARLGLSMYGIDFHVT